VITKNAYTCIIADDDDIYRELTKQQLTLIPGFTCMADCDNAIDVSAMLHHTKPDVLILDVEMPGLTGIQLAKSLKDLPLIIFISSHTHYAAEAYDIDAIDYLVKPVAPDRFMRAMEKARALIEMKTNTLPAEGFKNSSDEAFFIKDKTVFIKINYTEVLYIESLGDFVNIYLENGEKKIALVSLKNIEQQLPAAHFIRISRSQMVNKNKISSLETTCISLGKIQLHVGKTYTDTILEAVIGNNALKRFL
jgi:two-component system, LytTR family, response regulator